MSTARHHQANECKSSLEAEWVRARVALCSLRSKKMLVAEKWLETYLVGNTDEEQRIEDYVDREPAVSWKRVENAESGIIQGQEDMKHTENAGLTPRKPQKTFQAMLNAIRDSLSDLASADDEEDAENEKDAEDEEDDEEDTQLGRLSEDDEPARVMGRITRRVKALAESFRQKQIKPDKLTQPGCGDTANYLSEQDIKYMMAKSNVPAVAKWQTEAISAVPAFTTFGELIETMDIVPRISQMWERSSRPGSSRMRSGSWKPHSYKRIASLPPDVAPNVSQIQPMKPVEPVC